MKKVKLILVAVAIMVSSVSFATNGNPTTTKKELHNQIVSILGNKVEALAETNLEAEVSFTLNSKSEIVVLSVKSDNQKMENFVKNKLNYKKVAVKAVNEGKIYRVPLKIVNE